MTKFVSIVAAIGAAALTLTSQAALASPSSTAQAKGKARLAKILEGRTAGKPVDCIFLTPSTNMQVLDGTALVYGHGKKVYVNVPKYPKSLDSDDVIVTYQTSSSLCSLDRVETLDRASHFYNGNIFLGQFVPYTKQ